MKRRFIKPFLFLLVFSLASCSGQTNPDQKDEPVPTPIDTPFEFESDEAFAKDECKWLFEEDVAYSKSINMSISSDNASDNMKLYLDGTDAEAYHSKEDKLQATLAFDLDPKNPCSTESVEACQNTIRLNGKYVGLLHNDKTLTTDFDSEDFLEGENIVTLTIGYVYLNKEFDKKNVSYKLGWGDDFRLKNFGIQFDDGTLLEPTKMIGYYATENLRKYVTQEMEVEPDTYYWIGDGWANESTTDYVAHIGHSDKSYERPFAIDYYFNYSKKNYVKSYEIDSTTLKDGKHILTAVNNSKHVLQNHIYIDNTAPKITHNLKDDMTISNLYPFTLRVKDDVTSVASKTIKVDGKKVTEVDLANLEKGKHSITITAEDSAGNSTAETICFTIGEQTNYLDASDNDGSINLNRLYSGEVTYCENSKIQLTKNTTSEKEIVSSSSLPSQEYTFKVSDTTEDVLINFDGETEENENILFEAYNFGTKSYENVYIGSNGINKFKVNPTNYLDETDHIKIRVSPLKVDNGSNKMLWASDIQYLAKTIQQFKDLSEDYGTLMKYMANEYSAGNIAYMINTGDIVDDNPEYGSAADLEWQHASEAFDYVDEVGFPYGVLAGNHDVGSAVSALDYSYYSKYFGTFRTGDKNYYGQSLNDNACHYDLITVGDYDFVVVYLGYGVEGTLETIEWANKVLQKYKNRNAIVATHAYLENSGDYDDESRAQVIYDEIVVPNDNVKIVMCGHTDGGVVNRKRIGEDRVFFEILSCYQFVETETDDMDMSKTKHLTNGYKCNGEGWIKEITVKDNGQMVFHTFSPVLNNHYFSSNNGKSYVSNDFTIKVDMNKKQHVIKTNSIEAYQLGKYINRKSTKETYVRQNNDSIIYISDFYDGYTFVL